MYKSKVCKHFVKQVREELELAFCPICEKTYEMWEIYKESQVPVKYHYIKSYKEVLK